MKKPEEYEDVLVYGPDGRPIIAHRNSQRWYGYTGLHWLDFEPTSFTPLGDLATLQARIDALVELVKWLKEANDFRANEGYFNMTADKEHVEHLDFLAGRLEDKCRALGLEV